MRGTGGELSGRKRRYYNEPGGFYLHDEHDWYIEPAWCVEALLDAEPFDGSVWDPACGIGTIPKVCNRYGLVTVASDIADRGYGTPYRNFLTMPYDVASARHIITNPPYKETEAFVRQALRMPVQKAAFLIPAKFLFSQSRHQLFTQHPPARLYILSRRPSMPPGEAYLRGDIEAKGGKVDYLWAVWDRSNRGPTTMHWLLPRVSP